MTDIDDKIKKIDLATTGQKIRRAIVEALEALNIYALPEPTEEDVGKTLVVDENGVWAIGEAGGDTAKALIEGTLPSHYESGATQVCEGAFSRYPYIDTIVLPAASTLGAFAFSTSSVVSISAPEATTLGRYCFHYCDALRSADLPKVVIVPEYAFAHSGLGSISLPAAEEIGASAFEGGSLAAVSMPAVRKIGSSAFAECPMSELTLPSCEEIGYEAFARCWALTKVTLPAVTTIGAFAFAYSALSHLYLASNAKVTTDRSIGYIGGTLTVHVPADLVSEYQADAVWGQYNIVAL